MHFDGSSVCAQVMDKETILHLRLDMEMVIQMEDRFQMKTFECFFPFFLLSY